MIKVNKILQVKSNMYELSFDNNLKIKVYDEVIIKFNLVLGTPIQESFIEEIKKYNDLMIIFFKFRNSLIKKLVSKKKILSKLSKEGISNEDIEELVYKLEKLNLINDDNFMKAFISDQINLTLNGPIKIKNELLKENISVEKIDEELSNYDEEFWENRINKIINKRKKSNHKDSFNVFKLKTKSYIYTLGYNSEINFENDSDESVILKKEYEKLVRKYERKNLDKSKIKYDLLKKGFKQEDIKKLEQ